jgi:hypothetical protein
MADSSAPLAGNLNAYIKTPEPVKSHYQCTSIALRVESLTTAGDHPKGRPLASLPPGGERRHSQPRRWPAREFGTSQQRVF